MSEDHATYRAMTLTVTGVLLFGFALIVDDAAIKGALVSDPSRTLSWGPTLFRLLLAFHGIALVLTALVWRKRALVAGQASAPAVVAQRTGRACWLALGGLSVAALGLRLWHLNSDLWYDEILTLIDFVRPPLGDIVTSFPSQNQHMLYSVLAHFSVSLFGESAWAVRLPSVIFGVASLWALFLLGRRIMDAREALLACALMTVSYHHIWFSQNARGYMGLMFFSTLAVWLWIEARLRDGWAWWFAYAAALALGMWIHMTIAFVAGAQALLYFIQSARERRMSWKPLVAWLLFASLTLQLHALSLPEFLRTALHEPSLESEWTNPLWVITESLRSLRVGFSGLAVLIGGAVVVGLGWFSLLRKDWQSGLVLVLPALLAGSTMLALGHNLWPRFFFFSMGFALLIAVHGAVKTPQVLLAKVMPLRRGELWGSRGGLALATLMIVASALTLPRCYALPKQDFTGARAFVEQRRQAGDAIVSVGLAGGAYGRYFARDWLVAQTEPELLAIQRDYGTVWLVYTIPIQVKAYCPDIWKHIENDYQVVKVFPGTLGGGEVYVCQKQQPMDLSKNRNQN